jgi:prephenate dehydrogenase
VHLVPAHPMAGTEHSGPDAGFAELFEGRYCIVTPLPGSDPGGGREGRGAVAPLRLDDRDAGPRDA